MIARMLGGYQPRHARRRGRYRLPAPKPSGDLYAFAGVAVIAALTWPIPAVVV